MPERPLLAGDVTCPECGKGLKNTDPSLPLFPEEGGGRFAMLYGFCEGGHWLCVQSSKDTTITEVVT